MIQMVSVNRVKVRYIHHIGIVSSQRGFTILVLINYTKRDRFIIGTNSTQVKSIHHSGFNAIQKAFIIS